MTNTSVHIPTGAAFPSQSRAWDLPEPLNVLTGSCLSTFYLTEMAPTPPWVLEPREPSPGFCSWGLGLFWLYCALSLPWFHPLIIPTSFSLHPLQYLGREQSDGSLPQKYPDIFLIWAAYFCVIGEVKLQMGRGVLPTRLQKVLGAAEKAENLWLFFQKWDFFSC